MDTRDIKGLILQNPIEDLPEKQKQKRHNTTDYKVEIQSGCDFVVSRVTPKTKKILVILVSQGQYYIKDETSTSLFDSCVESVTEASLSKFLDGVKDNDEDVITLPDVNWLDRLPQNKYERSIFLETLDKLRGASALGAFAKKGYFYTNYIHEYYHHEKSLFNDDMAGQDPSLWMSVVDMFAKAAGVTKKAVLQQENDAAGLGGLKKSVLLDNFGSVMTMKKAFGQEIALNYIDLSIRNHVESIVQSYNMVGLLSSNYASDPYEMHGESRADNPFKFDGRRLAEYLVYDADHQGLTPSDAANLLHDTLAMQISVFGKVREKYPKYLETEHRIMIKLHKQVQQKIDQENWNAAAAKASELEYEGQTYVIIAPKTPTDMYDEAQQQSNCLRSYVPSVTNGKCLILFMRCRKTPEKSLVTIEVLPDGTIRQAYRAFNHDPSHEEKDFIRKWAEKKGLVYQGSVAPRPAPAVETDGIGTARVAV